MGLTKRVYCDGSSNFDGTGDRLNHNIYKNDVTTIMSKNTYKRALLLDTNTSRAIRTAIDYVYDNYLHDARSIRNYKYETDAPRTKHVTIMLDNETLKELIKLVDITKTNKNRVVSMCINLYFESEFFIP